MQSQSRHRHRRSLSHIIVTAAGCHHDCHPCCHSSSAQEFFHLNLLPLGYHVVSWPFGLHLLSRPFCSVDCYFVCWHLILRLSSCLPVSWHPSCLLVPTPPLPLVVSLLILSLRLLLCLRLSSCPSPLVDCRVVCLSLRSSYGHHSSFALVADCYVINATLLPSDGTRRMLYWLVLWPFPPSMLLLLPMSCRRYSSRCRTPPITLRALTLLMFLLWNSKPVATSARDDTHS